jgi:hypothetical protein
MSVVPKPKSGKSWVKTLKPLFAANPTKLEAYVILRV